jgi:hypothetical protein
MKRKFVLLFLILILAAICIIPVPGEKTVLIKAPFLQVFTQLQTAKNWKNWRNDLRKADQTDSDKIAVKIAVNHFTINYLDLALNVKLSGGSFDINEHNKNGDINYSLSVIPDKVPVNSFIVIKNTLPLLKYVYGIFKDDLSDKTHITDLKKYMETDSLYYGYRIFKTHVAGTKLIVMRKTVRAENQFTEAAKMHSALKQFVKTHGLKRGEPLIAQFIASDKDSVQLTVGLYVDTVITAEGGIHPETMPKNGPGYSIKFSGNFSRRPQLYSAIRRYFADHSIQPAILPFDIYLDDKLPTSDTSKVNIQSTICTFY